MCHTQAPSRGADAPADDARGSVVDATLEELTAVDPATAAVLQDAEAPLEGNLTRAPLEHCDAPVRGARRLPALPRLRRPPAHPHVHVQRRALRGARGVQRRRRPDGRSGGGGGAGDRDGPAARLFDHVLDRSLPSAA